LVILYKAIFPSPSLKTTHVLFCKRRKQEGDHFSPIFFLSSPFLEAKSKGMFLGGLYPRKQIK
jgi:hypothetical protein